ncbi:hypothetical protein B7494_g2595 [Chlorociboria aeruginascens]|nr:hypothetical protein B7494_g2595 [Chlorociboria aeruginascens]
MKVCVAPRGNFVGRGFTLTKSCELSTFTARRNVHREDSTARDEDIIEPASARIEDIYHETPKVSKPRSLPVSPLMDPSFLAARNKHQAVKRPPPRKPATPFQQKLYNNPYARALATPPRTCNVTRQVMPKFFLLDFNLMAHPVTKTPYWVPRSLAGKYKAISGGGEGLERSEDRHEDEGIDGLGEESGMELEGGEEGGEGKNYAMGINESGRDSGETPETELRGDEKRGDINGLGRDLGKESETNSTELEMDSELKSTAGTTEVNLSSPDTEQNPPPSTTLDPKLPKIKTSSIGPRIYLSARQLLFRGINTSKSGLNHLPQHLAPIRMASIKESRYTLKRSIWREDMPDFLLELMRRRAAEALIYLALLKKGYLGACTDWEDVKRKQQVGAILWMRGKDTPRSMGDRADPGEFATLDVTKGSGVRHRIPIHNLERLLGEKHIQELKNNANWIFRTDMVVLKHKRNTIDSQEMLWKLQGFLAEHGYLDRPGEDLVT